MSVKNQKLSKSNLLNRVGVWEFSPDFESLNNINNPIRTRKKANLRRGKNFISTKSCNISSRTDTRMQSRCEIDTRKSDMKKLRNAKELDNCRTARSHSATSIKGSHTGECPSKMRTRSMSPTPSTPPVDAELPLAKFYSYFTKIIDQFEIIKIFIKRDLDTAESLQELNRQKKRATEFAVRFSRNNIYQMKRIVNEIKQIIVPYPFDNLAKSDSEILCKKILLAYQTAAHAFQTYINYMKSGQSLDVPEKIRELVLLVVDLYLCCEHLSIPKDQIDLLTSCKELLVLLDDKIIQTNVKAPATRQSEKVKEGEREENRFSMYKTRLTNSSWKKKTEALAKVKFGVPKLSYIKKLKKLEEKTALPRTTLEIYSQKRQLMPGRTKSTKNASDDNAKGTKTSNDRGAKVKRSHYTPREVTSQDDDIETVVQSIEDENVLITSPGFPQRSQIMSGDFCDERSNSYNTQNFRQLVLQAVQELQTSENWHNKNLFRSLNLPTDLTPRRNVKLIHMTSNEPIPEESETEEEIGQRSRHEGEKTKKSNNLGGASENEKGVVKAREGKLQTILHQEPVSQSEKNTFKVKLIKVPKETTKLMLQYKKMLCEYRKSNVMYRKGIKVNPCELVLRISDQIINDVLHEISSGMESENLLDQLYRNELLEVPTLNRRNKTKRTTQINPLLH